MTFTDEQKLKARRLSGSLITVKVSVHGTFEGRVEVMEFRIKDALFISIRLADVGYEAGSSPVLATFDEALAVVRAEIDRSLKLISRKGMVADREIYRLEALFKDLDTPGKE